MLILNKEKDILINLNKVRTISIRVLMPGQFEIYIDDDIVSSYMNEKKAEEQLLKLIEAYENGEKIFIMSE